VRFAGARAEGLREDEVAQVVDGYEDSSLPARERAALRLADAIVETPRSLAPAEHADLRVHWSEAQAAELALGIGLFHALSKTLIVLGLEPPEMALTELPSPGSG
jgi:alkylhydroperoxidase family enzyme